MNQEQKKLSKFLNILTNIIFIPILLVSILFSVLMYSAKQNNQVPSLFGMSTVVVLSNSMQAGGFGAGDYVMVKRTKVSNLRKNDIIAFYGYYNYKYSEDDVVGYESSSSSSSNINIWSIGAFTDGQKEAAEKASPVIFHRITRVIAVKNKDGVFDENDPTCFYFFTKGDSNGSEDAYAIRGDMVIGSYYEQGNWLTGIFKFCSSTVGLIILVLIPAGALLILLGHSIVEQVSELKHENSSNVAQYSFAEQIYQEQINDKLEEKEEQEKKEKQIDKHEEIKRQIEAESGIKIDDAKLVKQETKITTKKENQKPLEKPAEIKTENKIKEVEKQKVSAAPKKPETVKSKPAEKPTKTETAKLAEKPLKPKVENTTKTTSVKPQKPETPKLPKTPKTNGDKEVK